MRVRYAEQDVQEGVEEKQTTQGAKNLTTSLTVDQDVHLHGVVGRHPARPVASSSSSATAAAAAVAGVIAGIADVGLGDEEAGHLKNEQVASS